MNNSIDIVKKNLRAFKRKYYFNNFLKGAILFISSVIIYYLLISIFEYFFWLSTSLRWLLLLLLIGVSLFSLMRYILYPILQMVGLGKTMEDTQAAQKIGTHFSHINDKLLNFLQLQKLEKKQQNDLLTASINQKAHQIQNVNFSTAISYQKSNKKYLPYLFLAITSILLILFFYPALISDSAQRIWHPSETFVPKAPFKFILLNKDLLALKNQNIQVNVALEGNNIPEKLFMSIDGKKLEMKKEKDNIFSYTFQNIQKPIHFNFYSDPYFSSDYHIQVFDKLSVNQFRVFLDYPSQFGLKDEWVNNLGDLNIPEGTRVVWNLNSKQAREVDFFMGNTFIPFSKNEDNFDFQNTFYSDTTFDILLQHSKIAYNDTLHYNVVVIKDQNPSLKVEMKKDTSEGKYIVLLGDASDDYGLAALQLIAIQKTPDGKVVKSYNTPLPIKGHLYSNINFLLNINNYHVLPGNTLQYYIKATDNDALHGGKSVVSEIYEYKAPSMKEIQLQIEKNNVDMNNALSNSSSKSKESEALLEEAKRDMLNKNNLTYEDKQNVEKLLQKTEEMKKNLDDFKKKMEEQEKLDKEKLTENLEEKKEDLKKMADDILQKKIAEEMKKIQDLLSKLEKKEKPINEIEKLQESQKNLQNALERMQEMAKKLEMQVNMQKLADKVDAAALKELKMALDMKQKNQNDQKLDNDRKEMNELHKAIDKDMQEINDQNKDLKAKMNLEKINDENKDSKNNAESSDNDRQKNKMNTASEKSNDANKNMMKMAEMLRKKANDQDEDQMEEDIASMRRLLQNLIRMSFNQENLLNLTSKTLTNTPMYPQLAQKQQDIKLHAAMIEDSLKNLALRQPKIAEKIIKESIAMKSNIDKSIDVLEDRNTPLALKYQQYSMTHINNLTLIFGEALNASMMELNAQNKNGKPGQGMPQNPGGKKPGNSPSDQLSDIITQQKKLGDGMQQMKDAMGKKPGDSPGNSNPQDGNKNGKGSEGNNAKEIAEQLARMARQQEDLRKQLQNLNNELKKNGANGIPELNDVAKQMDKNETDIVNKKIQNDLLRRQQEILSKLLKSQDAVRQQEQGEERQKETAKIFVPQIPQELLPYLNKDGKVLQKYNTIPPSMQPYYKNMLQSFYQSTGK